MWREKNGKKKLRAGKLFVFIVLSIFSLVGMILCFFDNPGERVTALCQIFQAIVIPLSIMTGGVAVDGILAKRKTGE